MSERGLIMVGSGHERNLRRPLRRGIRADLPNRLVVVLAATTVPRTARTAAHQITRRIGQSERCKRTASPWAMGPRLAVSMTPSDRPARRAPLFSGRDVGEARDATWVSAPAVVTASSDSGGDDDLAAHVSADEVADRVRDLVQRDDPVDGGR